MKKLIMGVLAIALGILGAPTARAVDTNNYTVTSYVVEMMLGRDGENRSMLSAKETITAEFPDYDQNHGFERALVMTYEGHSLSLNVTSVTDSSGRALNFHWSNNTLRIGDADTYVHGSQTYVISYTMRDVTKYSSNTAKDEFYWDMIGLDFSVPILSATIHLSIDPALRDAFTGDAACYYGALNVTNRCELQKGESGFSAEVDGLGPREGVSFAVGFKQGTFAAYEQSFLEKLFGWWGTVQFILSPLAVIVMIWFFARFSARLGRKKEIGTIVPEYLPPKDVSVTAAARVGGYTRSVMTAQMIDLAVRHYVKIYEVKGKTLFSPAQYEIEAVQRAESLRDEEQEILKDTFGGLPVAGSRLNLKELQNNPAYYQSTLNNDADLEKLIRGEYGLKEQDNATKNWSRKYAITFLIVGLVFVSPFWLILALVAFFTSFLCWRLTDKGLELKRYLEGLKMYISVAEEERIKMLQSPEGAEKVSEVANGIGSSQLIKLYERVLPYAVLFGQEKQWNKQLGRYYEAANVNPDWYAGYNGAFNAAMFSNAMSSFSGASSSASSYSSSSGGSDGGGFSGGGGGGGGGGGW